MGEPRPADKPDKSGDPPSQDPGDDPRRGVGGKVSPTGKPYDDNEEKGQAGNPPPQPKP